LTPIGPKGRAAVAGPLLDRILRTAEANPAAPAFIFQDSILTRGQVLALLRGTTRLLRERGIRAGDAVGLSMGRWPMHCVAFLALARLGAVSIPLAPGLSAAERAATISRFGIRAIVTNWDLAGVAVPVCIRLDTLSVQEDAPEPDVGGFVPDEHTPLRIALTSGTTGERKGILHTHGTFADRIDKTLYECDESTRFLPPDLHITVGMVFAIGVLARGGTVVFDKTFHAQDIASTIRLYGVTHCLIAPASLSRFAAAIPARGLAFPSLRHLRIVGAMPSASQLETLRTRFSPNIYVPYGLTELGVVSLATPETLAAAPASAGRISPRARGAGVGGAGRPPPPGTTGEIRVAMEGMPGGYHGESGAQGGASKFRQGWFYPGDIGKVSAQGLLFIEGRTDDVVNVGGHKFSLASMDGVVAEHPGVGKAVAFVLEDGDADPSLGAAIGVAIVMREGASLDDILRHCRERLESTVPVRLFPVADIAHDDMGKVNRGVARALALRRGAAA
jgi:acyl-coenzyme A synthetase/AMP-(fatty) acid ligase